MFTKILTEIENTSTTEKKNVFFELVSEITDPTVQAEALARYARIEADKHPLVAMRFAHYAFRLAPRSREVLRNIEETLRSLGREDGAEKLRKYRQTLQQEGTAKGQPSQPSQPAQPRQQSAAPAKATPPADQAFPDEQKTVVRHQPIEIAEPIPETPPPQKPPAKKEAPPKTPAEITIDFDITDLDLEVEIQEQEQTQERTQEQTQAHAQVPAEPTIDEPIPSAIEDFADLPQELLANNIEPFPPILNRNTSGPREPLFGDSLEPQTSTRIAPVGREEPGLTQRPYSTFRKFLREAGIELFNLEHATEFADTLPGLVHFVHYLISVNRIRIGQVQQVLDTLWNVIEEDPDGIQAQARYDEIFNCTQHEKTAP